MPRKSNPSVSQAENPAVPFVEIGIGGRIYKMTITYRALATAERELNRRGHDVNLLRAKVKPSLDGTRAMFAASLLHYHPEVSFEEAEDMVDDETLDDVLQALAGMERKTLPDPDPDNPRQPAQ